MEKYSAFRDPGTGIQPFLTPVPASSSNEIVRKTILPFALVVGAAKNLLFVMLGVLYIIFVQIFCLPLTVVPPVHRAVKHLFTALLSRSALLVTGIWWIPVEVVNRNRGRNQSTTQSTWRPRSGDIIVSNWVSWIEILWLAFRFDPIFVLPVCEPLESPDTFSQAQSPAKRTPGRRTGTGSALLSSPHPRAPSPRSTITGFQPISLLSMLRATGSVPPYFPTTTAKPLEHIRRSADRPLVVFPECTTSNGRGLLRFADVFKHESNIPVKRYNVFVMCVRYDPPTSLLPTLSHSISSKFLNPLPHQFSLASNLVPLTLSIRLLAPSESPSSDSFKLSDTMTKGSLCDDPLSDACADLIAHLGKMKRTGLGWEDKTSFLEFYKGKHK